MLYTSDLAHGLKAIIVGKDTWNLQNWSEYPAKVKQIAKAISHPRKNGRDYATLGPTNLVPTKTK